MSIDGVPVDRSDAISRTLAHKRAGDSMELTIYRGGRTVNIAVHLGDNGERM
jgi:S1-C subfamily serine protease